MCHWHIQPEGQEEQKEQETNFQSIGWIGCPTARWILLEHPVYRQNKKNRSMTGEKIHHGRFPPILWLQKTSGPWTTPPPSWSSTLTLLQPLGKIMGKYGKSMGLFSSSLSTAVWRQYDTSYSYSSNTWDRNFQRLLAKFQPSGTTKKKKD